MAMATTTAFSSLSVPAPDDTMEMSSPANQPFEDDIDIDFDDDPGGVQVTDDERMLEDSDPTRPTTATDDMMYDDMLQPGEQFNVDAEFMHDDTIQIEDLQQHQEDEELIDYGEEEFQDQVVEESTTPNLAEDSGDTGLEQIDEEIQREPEGVQLEDPSAATIQAAAAEIEQVIEPPVSVEDDMTAAFTLDEGLALETHDARIDETVAEELIENAPSGPEEQEATNEEVVQPRMSVNTAISAQADTPGTPTDTGLHPMNVRYGDLKMPLFRSRRQPDGLLKDDNLASLSLAELIRNCRQRLALKIGENISEDQELVLGFDNMGLMLVEVCCRHTCSRWTPLTIIQDSRSAFESSLNDAIDVYLQLHRNDGTSDVPPLSLHISLQLKFASSFNILKQAAAGGQGMSSFGFLHPAGEEEYYQEEYGEDDGDSGLPGDDLAKDGVEEQYEEAAYANREDVADQEDHQGEENEAQQNEEDSGEDAQEEDYLEQEDYHEDAADEENAEDQGELAEELKRTEQEFHQSADAVYNVHEHLSATGLDSLTEDQMAPSYTALGKANEVDSTASSTTIHADSVNDTTGEYNNDLMDWDDDSLISETSERTADVNDDFSTFLTEYEDGERPAATKDYDHEDAQVGTGEATAYQDIALLANQPNQFAVDPEYLGSKDFLDELGHQEYEDETHYYEEDHDAGQEEEEEGQYDFDQADTYDKQHDEYNPDYQPGEEDDEQFHTAHDFLNGEGYEHGLEHDPEAEEEAFDDTVIHHEVEEYPDDDEQDDLGEELGFTDETEPPEEQQALRQPGVGPPLGKRSFDEIDELDDEQPELKKARSS